MALARAVRLFVDVPLAAGTSISPSLSQTHHLVNVMRRKVDDDVLLFNGRDGEWAGKLTMARRTRSTLLVRHRLVSQPESETDLWLVHALLKREASGFLVEKATELGASAIFPVITERTIASPLASTPERLRAIAIGASEQCERVTVPDLRPTLHLSALLSTWPQTRRLLVAVERASPLSTLSISKAALLPGPKALLVGPEGGFCPAEVNMLLAQPFTTSITLGPRILRAETAALAGLAIMQAVAAG